MDRPALLMLGLGLLGGWSVGRAWSTVDSEPRVDLRSDRVASIGLPAPSVADCAPRARLADALARSEGEVAGLFGDPSPAPPGWEPEGARTFLSERAQTIVGAEGVEVLGSDCSEFPCITLTIDPYSDYQASQGCKNGEVPEGHGCWGSMIHTDAHDSCALNLLYDSDQKPDRRMQARMLRLYAAHGGASESACIAAQSGPGGPGGGHEVDHH